MVDSSRRTSSEPDGDGLDIEALEKSNLHFSCTAIVHDSDQSLVLVRRTRGKREYVPQTTTKLRNSLLFAVGLLELANAGDFPANVWNEDPLPRFAIILMAFGGTLALSMLYFVVKDSRLSWKNICGLKEERRYLHAQRQHYQAQGDKEMIRCIDCYLLVNFRELGTEIVDRFGMDMLLGFGALLVAPGTYIAIAGANPKIHLASDLMTGYIGNTPCAIYGLFNLAWSGYVWKRARQHRTENSHAPTPRWAGFRHRLNTRTRHIQIHSTANGITGIVAGAASLATATQWWAYIVLVPCLISSALLNLFWRRQLGYDRPFVRNIQESFITEDTLIDSLRYTEGRRTMLSQLPEGQEAVAALFQGTCLQKSDSLESSSSAFQSLLVFIISHQLFDDFCVRLLAHCPLRERLYPTSPDPLLVDAPELIHMYDQLYREQQSGQDGGSRLADQLLEIARSVVNEKARMHFVYTQRWQLEAIGYMALL